MGELGYGEIVGTTDVEKIITGHLRDVSMPEKVNLGLNCLRQAGSLIRNEGQGDK